MKFVYSRDSDPTLRNETISIVVLVPKEAQLDPTGNKGPQLLRGEGSGRRCSRPKRRTFSTQLFELIYPDVAVLNNPVEVLASLRCSETRAVSARYDRCGTVIQRNPPP